MRNTQLFALAILLMAVVAMLLGFWSSVMMVAGAGVLAYLLLPLVKLLVKRTPLNRPLAVCAVMLALAGLLAGVAAFTLPTLIRQITGLISELVHFSANLDTVLADLVVWLREIGAPDLFIDGLMDVLAQLDTYLTALLSKLLGSVMTISSGIFDGIVIIILVVYFLLDWDKLMEAFIGIFPRKVQPHVNRMRVDAHTMVWKYVGSRCIVSGIMALATYIGLTVIGVPYSLLFALLSFILDFIPYFGSMVAGIIEAVVALFTGGLSMAAKTAIFVLIVQQIEGNIIAPKVQSDSVGLHPITVMFALLACQQLWGPVGMLVSTPVAALVKMILHEVFRYIFPREPEEAPAEKAPANT